MEVSTDSDSCPGCGSTQFFTDYQRGEIVCSLCGTIIRDRMIDSGPPSARSADGGKQQAEVSADHRLRPQLHYSSRDSEGRPVAGERLWPLRQTAQTYNLDSRERAAILFEGRLRRAATQRGIPDGVVKRAVEIYYQVREARIFKKPSLDDLALALLMAASREMRYILPYEDLIGDSEKKKKISKVSKIVAKAGPYSTTDSIASIRRWPNQMRFTVQNFVIYYAGKLDLAYNGLTVAEALNKIEEHLREFYPDNTTAPAPHVMAAAALYIALEQSGIAQSQREYCVRVNLSEISLREWYRKLGGADLAA